MKEWHKDCLTIKLEKKEKGEKLVDVVDDSLRNIGYEVSIKPDRQQILAQGFLRRYNSGQTDFDFFDNKQVVGHKYKYEPVDLTFQGKLKILYAIPILGRLMYAREKARTEVTDTEINTSLIKINEEYDEISFHIVRENSHSGVRSSEHQEKIDMQNISSHPNIMKDIGKLEENIYARLN